MKYKLIRRIQDGKSNCGYQLVSEDNKILFVSRATVIKLAKSGSIIGVRYNKSNNSLVSTNSNLALKELGTINLQDIYNKFNGIINNKDRSSVANSKVQSDTLVSNINQTVSTVKNAEGLEGANKVVKNNTKRLSYDSVSIADIRNGWVDRSMTKAQQAKEYLKVDSDSLELKICNDNYVILEAVRKLGPDNRIVIPEFVGGFDSLAFATRAFMCDKATVIFKGKAKDCGRLEFTNEFKDCWVKDLELIVEDSDRIDAMHHMFYYNSKIRSIKMMFLNGSFKQLKTYGTTSPLDYMFHNCKNLERVEIYSKSLNSTIPDMDTIDIWGLFSECRKLNYVDLSGFEGILNRAYWINELFSGCESLERIDLSYLRGRSLSKLKDSFNCCTALRSIDLSGLQFDKEIDCFGTFYKSLNLESIDTSNVSIIHELKRFNDNDLKEHTKKIRNTVELSNGVRVSLEEAERRKREMDVHTEELKRLSRLFNDTIKCHDTTADYDLAMARKAAIMGIPESGSIDGDDMAYYISMTKPLP